jgi:hypothetical protein
MRRHCRAPAQEALPCGAGRPRGLEQKELAQPRHTVYLPGNTAACGATLQIAYGKIRRIEIIFPSNADQRE